MRANVTALHKGSEYQYGSHGPLLPVEVPINMGRDLEGLDILRAVLAALENNDGAVSEVRIRVQHPTSVRADDTADLIRAHSTRLDRIERKIGTDPESTIGAFEVLPEGVARGLLIGHARVWESVRFGGSRYVVIDESNGARVVIDESEPDEPAEIPADFPVKVLDDDDTTPGRATCGTCGRSWDDTVSTSRTPTPGGRCPFEAFH